MRTPVLISSAFIILVSCNSADKKTTEAKAKDTAIVASATSTPIQQMTDSATMMKNWQEYMTTGKEHQMIKSWNGNWVGEITMWMSLGAPPSKSTITVVNRTIMGNRYQVTTQKGKMNGMPFEGQGILGYDNAKKDFILSWIDNMGTGISKLEGPWNETTKSMDLRGTVVDPGTGKEVNFRELFRIIDNDRQVLEMYTTGPDGKEMKTVEIIYTRKK